MPAPIIHEERCNPDRLSVDFPPRYGSIRDFLDSLFAEVYAHKWARPEAVRLPKTYFDRFWAEIRAQCVFGNMVEEGTTPAFAENLVKYHSPCGTVDIMVTNSCGHILFARETRNSPPITCLLSDMYLTIEQLNTEASQRSTE